MFNVGIDAIEIGVVSIGGGDVGAGESTTVVLGFDGASLAGSITLSGTTDAPNEGWQAVVPVSPRP